MSDCGCESRLRLAVASTGTAALVLVGAIWIINGVVDRADECELHSHYEALQSQLVQESRRAAAMSAIVAAMPLQQAMARGDRKTLMSFFWSWFRQHQVELWRRAVSVSYAAGHFVSSCP